MMMIGDAKKAATIIAMIPMQHSIVSCKSVARELSMIEKSAVNRFSIRPRGIVSIHLRGVLRTVNSMLLNNVRLPCHPREKT